MIAHPYQKLKRVFISPDNKYYHLHPELVSGGFVKIYKTCHYNLRCSEFPKFSVAAGIDFGRLSRLGLPQLLLVEELVISPSRLFASLVKFVGHHPTQRQTGKRGHIVIFLQPEGPFKLAELERLNSAFNQATYPRIENMKEYIGVVFIGARIQYEAMVPSLQCQELKIRVDVDY